MITVEQFNRWIDEMYEMYQREQTQAIRRREWDKATAAVGGMDACERLRNYLPMRAAMQPVATMITHRKRRA
jgi:hypothetical protein